jgi:hypothetical protein
MLIGFAGQRAAAYHRMKARPPGRAAIPMIVA